MYITCDITLLRRLADHSWSLAFGSQLSLRA